MKQDVPDTGLEAPAERTVTPELRRSLWLVVLGGSLAMVYMVGIGSPATTEFLRVIGANELHFGLISGIPLVMLFLQFIGAAVLNRVPRRKNIFIVSFVICRLMYLGVAFAPLLLAGSFPGLVIPVVILLIAISSAMQNLAVPFWFSWMADLIPKRVLNRIWGWRQRTMYFSWTLAFLLVTGVLYRLRQPVTVLFPILVVLAVTAGLTDVLLFLKVREPPHLMRPEACLIRDGLAPLRHPEFRTFVRFACTWSFAMMCASTFMQLYVLKVLNVDLWKAALIWCLQGLGTAMASGFWGRLADRHGQRPVITVCVALKPVIVMVFLLLTPRNVYWLLPLAFFPDGMINSGFLLGMNGYMLSIAPRENRSMFIAAITGLAGIFGGISAMIAGAVLSFTSGWSMELWGHPVNHYHLLFGASLLMRLYCIPIARAIREPGSSRSRELINAILDDWPSKMPRFPVGLYRRNS